MKFKSAGNQQHKNGVSNSYDVLIGMKWKLIYLSRFDAQLVYKELRSNETKLQKGFTFLH